MVRLHRWLFGLFGLGTCIVAACVSDAPATSDGNDAGGTDALTDGTQGSDAISNIDADTGPCNIDAPFGTPALVQGLPIINSVVRFSEDELTAYFAMQVIDDGGPFSLYQATRASMTAPFGAPVALDALNDDAGESDPAVSIDGHDIIYVRAYGPPNTAPLRDIWHGSRATLDASFAGPTKIAGGVNVDGIQEDYPSLAANDDLWFISTRGDAGQAIYRGKTAGGINYASVDIAANINAPGTKQYYPVVSPDGRRIYYLRDQTLYTATRDSTDNFSNPSAVTELNSALPGLRPGWVSPDNCRLYVTVGSPQTAYVAAKPPN